jgi:hypothetical protein
MLRIGGRPVNYGPPSIDRSRRHGGLPTCLSGAAAEYGTGLGRWEWWAGYAAGGVSVTAFVPLVVFG